MRFARAGMTLIEVMISMAILGMIAVMVAMSLSSALKARDSLADNDDMQQSARIALSTISRELRLAYLTANTGTPNTYQTVFIGKDTGPDSIWFATLGHQRLYRDARESDQTEITIWAEDDPHMDGYYVLMHREAPRIDHEPDKDGVIYPLAYGVKSFIVRYLNPTDCTWTPEWDTTGSEQPNLLPRAAQIVLTLMGPDPENEGELKENTFATTVVMHYGRRAKCEVLDTEGDGSRDPADMGGGGQMPPGGPVR